MNAKLSRTPRDLKLIISLKVTDKIVDVIMVPLASSLKEKPCAELLCHLPSCSNSSSLYVTQNLAFYKFLPALCTCLSTL